MVRLLNQRALFPALMLVLLPFSGCHHIHWGYGVPMYMQPKGFSMTYKEHLYSTPIFADYSRASWEGAGEGQRTNSYQRCSQPPNYVANYDAEIIKGLMEGDATDTQSQKAKIPQVPQTRSPVRIGLREVVPNKVSRSNRRF